MSISAGSHFTPTPAPTPTRASTGLSLNFLDKIGFHKEPRIHRPVQTRTGSFGANANQTPRASLFSLPAAEGAGLKARRRSAAYPDEFVVETSELDDCFVTASKIGRRKECGKGASATVKIMVRKSDRKSDNSQQLAVKEYRKRQLSETEDEYVKKVKSEFTIAKSLSHPNIVQTFQLCTHNGRWNHVMEYCQQGELFALVERRYFKADDKQCIFKQVLRAVAYLHDHGIAHRDIKLENLLMTDQGYVKLTDFGISEVFCGDHPGSPTSGGQCGKNMGDIRKSAPGVCGSKPYISPEVLNKTGEYDSTKLDVWSCGILYMTLHLGGNPWQSASKSETRYSIFCEGWDAFLTRSSELPIDEISYPQCGNIFGSLSTNAQRRCVLKMLHPNPDKRCTIQEALNDRWIKNIDCCSPDPEFSSTNGAAVFDVSTKASSRAIARMKVQAKHDHLPPPVKRMPQHKFDMGDGTSRYD